MHYRWYSLAVSTLLVGCGGNAELGDNARNTNKAGSSSIDGGAPSATGGMPVAYYGVPVTGGTPSTSPITGGAAAIATCPATEPDVGNSCSGDMACDYGRSVDCAFPCAAGCTPVAADGSQLGSEVSANSVCVNGKWSIVAERDCPTAANCQCGIGESQRTTQLRSSCEASGGKIKTAQCCASTWDFPQGCKSNGACGCAPAYTKDTLECVCPSGCFDGTSCVQF